MLKLMARKKQKPTIVCKSHSPSFLVLLVPGAFLYPDDYNVLRQALLNHSQGSSLCLVTCAPDWSRLNVADFMTSAAILVNNSILEAIQAVKESIYGATGVLDEDVCGRYQRLVIIMHSLSGTVSTGMMPVKKASAIVLLASSISQSVSGISPTLRSFPLPVLSIFGDYDGQQHLGKVAIDVCNSGILFEMPHMRECYFAMIEKCNHASFSNGKRNAGRGDISIEGVDGASMEQVSHQVADLILTHFVQTTIVLKDGQNGNLEYHVAYLKEQTRASSMLVQGYLQELGRLPIEYSLESPQDKEIMQVLRYAGGNEMVHADKLGAGIMMYHPGQLARADDFAIHAQKFILGQENTRDRNGRVIVVTANVHTSRDNFMYSSVKQRVTPTTLYLEVQCLANAPLEKTEYTIVSPCYALKLISPQGINDDVELLQNVPTPKDIFNSLAWQRAERASAKVFRNRFLERGRQLTVTNVYHCLPHRWV